MKKRIIALLIAAVLCVGLFAGCGQSAAQAPAPAQADSSAPADTAKTDAPAPVQLTRVQAIIKEAEGMTMEELAKKAIEESNGKTLYGVGNSSRGKSALPLFIEYLKTIDPNYDLQYEWQQPKNNKIFDQLTSDSKKSEGTFALTLIQDGNQIESKMVQTGVLDTFIPKEWAEANGVDAATYTGYLPLQTLNKVFMYNNTGSFKPTNVWDFVGEGQHGQFMDIDSEIVGKNFLYMLTAPKYAGWLKESFDKLPDAQKAYFKPTIDAVSQDAKDLDFEDNTFDIIVSRNLTWVLEEPDKAYREWHRVLRSGGKMLNFDANWYNDGTQEVQDYIQLCQEHSLTHEASEYTVTDFSNYASNIDKVFRISDNTFDLADLKTYGKMTPEKLEKARWQLSIYAYLFELQNKKAKKAKARELYILHIRNKQKKDGSFDHISQLIPVKRIPSEICKELLETDLRGEQFQSPYDLPKEISSQEQRIRELILTKEAVEEELSGIKSQILTEMESRNVKTWITDGGIRLTRKLPTTRTSLNLTLLKEKHPEIDYDQYMRESQVSGSLNIAI